MYWYKTWCELRGRIRVSAAAIAASCVFAILMQDSLRRPPHAPVTYAHYLWGILYDSLLRDIFVLLTILFASGSLLQERPQGTLGFTLTLPITREHATTIRAIVGYLGVVLMAAIPAIVLPITSRLVGEHHSFMQAIRFTILYSCTGSVIYAFTFLMSHLMEGEYYGVLLTIPILVGYELLTALPILNRFPSLNLLNMMTGENMPWYAESSGLFTGEFPWLALAVMVAISTAFVYIAANRMTWRDFS